MSDMNELYAYNISGELEGEALHLMCQAERIMEVVRFITKNSDNLTPEEVDCLRAWLNHSDPYQVTSGEIIGKLERRE